MDFLSRLGTTLDDPRFTANLIAVHGIMVVLVLASLGVRRLLRHGSSRLKHWAHLERLEGVGKQAVRYGHTLLFWITLGAVVVTLIAGLSYHLAGRDVRHDLGDWYRGLTVKDLLRLGLAVAGVTGLAVASWASVRLLRRALPPLQKHLVSLVGRPGHEEVLRRWFALLERYAVACLRLGALWAAGQVVGLGHTADVTIGFVVRVLSIVVVARLLTMACRTVLHVIAEQGNRLVGKGHLHLYWERITRLFPFGEKCFDAAIYITAASLCVRALHFIEVIADFGPRVVQCIGIFFLTRVVIELLQVLLNEAFGLYREDRVLDQKGRTLVPLIHSLCQYVLYFGSLVVMLSVLGVETKPILAGAGILGLAVGLGAQSLVTDVVSGFFILFENQYLVGDYIQIGEAKGTVEAVGIRLTQVRDGKGKLYIIPNGQIKGVVNYSKGYVNAVVDIRVPSGDDLESVFRAMTEAGQRLRQARPEVLADTDIHGVVELSTSEMTVRAVTKVQPGTHGMMQNEYRRLLKQVLDQKQAVSGPALAA